MLQDASSDDASSTAARSSAPYVYAPYTKRASKLVPQDWVERYEREAAKNWDLFYQRHADRFFKDRHYLGTEWPELQAPTPGEASDELGEIEDADGGNVLTELLNSAGGSSSSSGGSDGKATELLMLEAGCGVGNTLFPLLQANSYLKVYGVEFSKTAVEIVQKHPLAVAGRVTAAVGDLTEGVLPPELSECVGRCDVATLMFVLSAISPGPKMAAAIDTAASSLRTGGCLLIRDYADGDGAQLRLRAATEANPKQLDAAGRFFVRQDGTRAYYFDTEELSRLVESRGLRTLRCEVTLRETTNRAKGLTIGRRYVTATFQKLSADGDTSHGGEKACTLAAIEAPDRAAPPLAAATSKLLEAADVSDASPHNDTHGAVAGASSHTASGRRLSPAETPSAAATVPALPPRPVDGAAYARVMALLRGCAVSAHPPGDPA